MNTDLLTVALKTAVHEIIRFSLDYAPETISEINVYRATDGTVFETAHLTTERLFKFDHPATLRWESRPVDGVARWMCKSYAGRRLATAYADESAFFAAMAAEGMLPVV